MALNEGLKTTIDEDGLPAGITPEDVLSYVYAILHAPSYRERYEQYLRSDFPRVPLSVLESAVGTPTFSDIWNQLVPMGRILMDLHLFRNVPSQLRPTFPVQGNNNVEKPRYEEQKGDKTSSIGGRVWINATQFFEGVLPSTWIFKVGGYQVCEKWLKDRKTRNLNYADIQRYTDVVAVLTYTRELMDRIDVVVNGTLWPKSS